jgi:hypothetical protein
MVADQINDSSFIVIDQASNTQLQEALKLLVYSIIQLQ